MKVVIQNFTNTQEIETTVCGHTIGLSCWAGAISFNFHMLPDQAEELAAALITNANEARAQQVAA